jgi:hypothetical protein
VGGTPGWNLSSSARRYGWPPPGLYLLVRRDFRPGLASASWGSGVAKLAVAKLGNPFSGRRENKIRREREREREKFIDNREATEGR